MVTIKDIANKAEVSMMTVSRTFNNPKVVKDEVRDKILKIAKELNYVPNQAAKSLATNKSGIIQIVSSIAPDNYYFTQIFTGAAHYLSEHGLSIMISQNIKKGYQHDGCIYMGLQEGEDRKLLRMEKKPFVLFGKSELPIDWVDIDNIDGVYQVTKHLIDMGHTNIGFIGIDQNEAFTKERYKGFSDAMNDNFLNLNDQSIFFIPHSIEGVKDIGEEVIACQEVTAFVCESDVLAYGLIDFCKVKGLSIPEDLSVVGFDGFMFNKLSNPHITTVVQPVYKIGVELAKALVNRINNPDVPKQELLIRTEFDPGESVKSLIGK